MKSIVSNTLTQEFRNYNRLYFLVKDLLDFIKKIYSRNPVNDLKKCLADEKARYQFVIRAGTDTEVLWNDGRQSKTEPVYKRSIEFDQNHPKRMKQSKDPFEAALEEQEESLPNSPVGEDELNSQTPNEPQNQTNGGHNLLVDDDDYDEIGPNVKNSSHPSSTSTSKLHSTIVNANVATGATTKNKEYDDDEEEENMEVELSKFPSSADPTKMAKMQAILSQFTEDQMSRYESFRRSALQRSNMRRLLVSITGSQKISLPMTIVVCGIAKMFVGELVEKARIVMTERKESGPIRPCHIREAYRRLKIEGKVPKRSVQRLFR
ncbi:hypothetical protein ES319_A10G181600v1 [Gossypium barbadense]|uniref:TAFII28-like protein domain-containing protein n=1 Tax=Gossypium barbadense TaxID=3634 RepID=A0A5J5U5I0_GOSBA|nr:hypothetical protein ES319_A10G181600v1 [Gossypium barbadense]KAB2062892.1 hypothetical protein ES319_A10G181600v1 [Gossypium barbadense]KAB2062893.1 hypothetical protein ES319_A10G181600v1 [Gossypium barbadense]